MNPKTPEELIKEIEDVNEHLSDQLSQFSEEELNRVTKEGSWTAGQVTEHILKSNGGILDKLLNGDVAPANRAFDEHADLIVKIFRSTDKMKTAAVLEPGPPLHEIDTLLTTLRQQKEQQLATINQKDLKDLSIELKFPPVPDGLSRYEWLILMLEHTERHAKQIESIKSS